LICASINGQLDIVEYLISKGANIEAKDNIIFSKSIIFMNALR
jgi:ankyrin repeat protein